MGEPVSSSSNITRLSTDVSTISGTAVLAPQELLPPVQFCEVVPGNQHLQHHPPSQHIVATNTNVIQANLVLSPSCTAVQPLQQHHQQQMLPPQQQQQHQQQLFLHSAHKPLQPPLAAALIPASSLSHAVPHHFPPASATLMPLHHQHQHHLHQIQLQQMHHQTHHQHQQQLSHHHQLHPHHHQQHLHAPHLYTTHPQQMQHQQHHQQIQQHQLQQHHLHHHHQQPQQQQHIHLQQKCKYSTSQKITSKGKQKNKSTYKNHAETKSSKKSIVKQNVSATGNKKPSEREQKIPSNQMDSATCNHLNQKQVLQQCKQGMNSLMGPPTQEIKSCPQQDIQQQNSSGTQTSSKKPANSQEVQYMLSPLKESKADKNGWSSNIDASFNSDDKSSEIKVNAQLSHESKEETLSNCSTPYAIANNCLKVNKSECVNFSADNDSTSLSSTADILKATLNPKGIEELDMKLETNESVSVVPKCEKNRDLYSIKDLNQDTVVEIPQKDQQTVFFENIGSKDLKSCDTLKYSQSTVPFVSKDCIKFNYVSVSKSQTELKSCSTTNNEITPSSLKIQSPEQFIVSDAVCSTANNTILKLQPLILDYQPLASLANPAKSQFPQISSLAPLSPVSISPVSPPVDSPLTVNVSNCLTSPSTSVQISNSSTSLQPLPVFSSVAKTPSQRSSQQLSLSHDVKTLPVTTTSNCPQSASQFIMSQESSTSTVLKENSNLSPLYASSILNETNSTVSVTSSSNKDVQVTPTHSCLASDVHRTVLNSFPSSNVNGFQNSSLCTMQLHQVSPKPSFGPSTTSVTLITPFLTDTVLAGPFHPGTVFHTSKIGATQTVSAFPTVLAAQIPVLVSPNKSSDASQNNSQTVTTQADAKECTLQVKKSVRSISIGTDSETLPVEDRFTKTTLKGISVSTNTSPPGTPLQNTDNKQNSVHYIHSNSSPPSIDLTGMFTIVQSFAPKGCTGQISLPSLASLPPTPSVSLAESAQLASSQPQRLIRSATVVNRETEGIKNDGIEVIMACTASTKSSVYVIDPNVKRESVEKDDEVTVIAVTANNMTPEAPATIPVKRTWRRPWKRKKEREKKQQAQQRKAPKKGRRCRQRKRPIYHRTKVIHIDHRNGPPIDTTKTVISRQAEENIDALKQKRQRIKLNRNSGREYINRLGKVVQARKIGKPCNCPMKCWERMGSKIVGIFNNFWDLSDFNLQNSYLFTCLKLCDVKRRYTKKPAEESRRQNTFEYFVRISGKHVRVCKRAFMSAHGLTSDKRIRTLLSQMKDGALLPVYDRRGKHLRPQKMQQPLTSSLSSPLLCRDHQVFTSSSDVIASSTSGVEVSSTGVTSSTVTSFSGTTKSVPSKKQRVVPPGGGVARMGGAGGPSGKASSSSRKRSTSSSTRVPENSSGHVIGPTPSMYTTTACGSVLAGGNGCSTAAPLQVVSAASLPPPPPHGPLTTMPAPGTIVQIHGVVPHCGPVIAAPAVTPTGVSSPSVVSSSHGPALLPPVVTPSVSINNNTIHASVPALPPSGAGGLQEPPHTYIPNGELYFAGHYIEAGQGMTQINQIPVAQCPKMLEGPAYFMAGMKENTFHQ